MKITRMNREDTVLVMVDFQERLMPAMRSSENYISFLIQRPDVYDHNIPLSELKIFLSRTEAEKYIDLNSGDIVEFSGRVFSTALGDPWMDASVFNVISSKPKTQN